MKRRTRGRKSCSGAIGVTWAHFGHILATVGEGLIRLESDREDGNSYTGTIRWDNDEQWRWEVLNGDSQNLVFHVEFGLIASIERASDTSARVTLLDGRRFVLRGSNDVNDENKGIFIRVDDGETVMLDWDEFERVEFPQPAGNAIANGADQCRPIFFG